MKEHNTLEGKLVSTLGDIDFDRISSDDGAQFGLALEQYRTTVRNLDSARGEFRCFGNASLSTTILSIVLWSVDASLNTALLYLTGHLVVIAGVLYLTTLRLESVRAAVELSTLEAARRLGVRTAARGIPRPPARNDGE